MTATYELWKIGQVIELATSFPRGWFRGHPDVFNELTPRIFRREYDNEIYRQMKPYVEFSIIEDFKRHAPALVSETPYADDHLSWLFLMQHHGAPTRLLDWTESALVALYFAVNNFSQKDSRDKDGELWAMHPWSLNKKSGFDGLPVLKHPMLQYLAAEPASIDPPSLVQKFGLPKTPEYPFAFKPPKYFSRMATQLSAFTIHPRPCPQGTIPDLLQDPKDLVRYVVPGKHKTHLLFDLWTLGIKRHTLFPDLDSLSISIADEHRMIMGYVAAPPPSWGKAP